MAFEDKTMTCVECNAEFIFTAREQEFYQQKGFQNEPKRCHACRTVRRSDTGRRGPVGADRGTSTRRLYPAVCASCGKDTEVPFEPRGIKPVYCSDCFAQQRAGSAEESRH